MSFTNLIEMLELHAQNTPDKLALCFLDDGERRESSLSYNELLERSAGVAGHLQALCRLGDRVLLLYPPGLEYIVAFFGCILAGVIPVPAYPPRNNHHLARIKTIVADAKSAMALTAESTRLKIQEILDADQDMKDLALYSFDRVEKQDGPSWKRPKILGSDIAFLQYTSGSTSAPKGVVVTHGNLLDNLATIKALFNIRPESRVFSWLPPYHDMGLIGGIMSPVYCNASCHFISPVHFIQKPFRWLQAISKYGITISGGPNFGYEYCVQKASPQEVEKLDLSSWEIAFNGSEPIRYSTLLDFSATFATCGFEATAFQACYGLAESTLLVAISEPRVTRLDATELERSKAVRAADNSTDSRTLLGISGLPQGQAIAIVDPENSQRCKEGSIGEIWLNSPSVAKGYWNNTEKTEEVFEAVIQGEKDGGYMRTGDLGFMYEGALYITGRIKELIIIRGANYYPHDIENVATESHEGINPEYIMAFSTDINGTEELIVLVEITRPFMGVIAEIVDSINGVILDEFSLQAYAVIPLKRGSLPKTSSGKKERFTARRMFLNNEFTSLAVAENQAAMPQDTVDRDVAANTVQTETSAEAGNGSSEIEQWLLRRITELTGIGPDKLDPQVPFVRYGLDSVKAVQMTGELEQWSGCTLSPMAVYEYPSAHQLAKHLIIVQRITELSSLGIRLRIDGDSVRASAPPGVLTPEIVAELKENEAQISNILNAAEKPLDVFMDAPIPRAPAADSYRLSPQQRRYIADFTWDSDRNWSTITVQSPFPALGDADVYQQAFNILCERHDCLRTVFPVLNGERRQLIGKEPMVSFIHKPYDSIGEGGLNEILSELRKEASQARWDCANGPLGKLFLITDKKDDCSYVLFYFHRIMMDAISVKLLVSEFMQVVQELQTGIFNGESSQPLRYRDFSEWLNNLEDAGRFLGARDYWRTELAGPLPDPFGFNAKGRASTLPANAAMAVRKVAGNVVEQLKVHAVENDWHFPMMLFAIYAVSLWKAGGGEEMVVDASLAGRHRPELKNILGFFTNAAAIRIHFSEDMLFSALVAQITRKYVLAEENQYFQYNAVIDDLGIDRHKVLFPLSGILFNTIKLDIPSKELMDEKKAWAPVSTEVRYGVMFYAMLHPDCLSLELKHRLALMDKETAMTIMGTYAQIIDRLVQAKNDLTIAELVVNPVRST